MEYLKALNLLNDVKMYLLSKYGMRAMENDVAPLEWYLKTGRASYEYCKALNSCKPFMIARRLHKGGSYDEALQRVSAYIFS